MKMKRNQKYEVTIMGQKFNVDFKNLISFQEHNETDPFLKQGPR